MVAGEILGPGVEVINWVPDAGSQDAGQMRGYIDRSFEPPALALLTVKRGAAGSVQITGYTPDGMADMLSTLNRPHSPKDVPDPRDPNRRIGVIGLDLLVKGSDDYVERNVAQTARFILDISANQGGEV